MAFKNDPTVKVPTKRKILICGGLVVGGQQPQRKKTIVTADGIAMTTFAQFNYYC